MTPVSVIVPVKDGAAFLERTLPALVASLPQGAELIVSDDGSSDASAAVAQTNGARLVSHPAATGPAEARNRGANAATGAILVFLDADVRVHADTLTRLLGAFEDSAVAAAFGSYDAASEARSWISLYKNLAHHFVHQRSSGDASTFWAGCGAIRASVFRELGGFDATYRRPSIEDVELGYRLRARGHLIRLLPAAQVTHLKEWSLASWLRADFADRAVPWARLLRQGRGLPRDLNFSWVDRAASLLVALGCAGLLAGALVPLAGLFGVAALALAVTLDARFLGFCAHQVGVPFAIAAAGLQLLHRIAGLAGLLIGFATPRPRLASSPPST